MTDGLEITYLAPAQRDLKRLLDFLTANEVDQSQARTIIMRIVETIRLLAEKPHLGQSFGGRFGISTPYRGLVVGKYIAVYEVVEASQTRRGQVRVRRIYHTREDYLTLLL